MGKKESKEYEFVDEQELEEIKRKSFRLPIGENQTVTASIEGKKYDVVNIVGSERVGIGIRLKKKDTFAIGEKLTAIQLILKSSLVKIKGIVLHVSPDGSGRYLCGIELINLDDETLTALRKFILESHANLFTKE